MEIKIIERYFFFGLLLATLFFAFLIFRPFWIVLVLSISFTIILYPIYKWMVKKGLPDYLSSFLTVFFLAIIILGPLLGIGVIVFNQSQNVYRSFVENGNVNIFIEAIDKAINGVLPQGVMFDAQQKISDFILFVSNNIAAIFSSTLSAFFSFSLMLLAIFYFLKDGAKWKKTLIRLSPLSDKDDRKILKKLTKAINGVMKGYLLIATIQGLLMGIGLSIFSVPNAALWGVVAAVASLIPMIGTALISVPAIIFLFITGSTASAFGLLIWSIVIVGTVDNILNPMVISGNINIPPILILFAVLGGISLLGPIGVLIGPLTISLLYALIAIYKNEFQEKST